MANILIVEDFLPVAKALAAMLRRHGHQIACAQTATGASRLEGYFDFAVLDIDLPDGNGVALAEKLLEAERIESVIFFTATRDCDLLARATRLGVVVDKTNGAEPLLPAIQALEDSVAARHVAMANIAIPTVRHLPISASAWRR